MLKSFSDRLVLEKCFSIIMNGLHTSDKVFFTPTCGSSNAKKHIYYSNWDLKSTECNAYTKFSKA